jgi:hypothetical protein
MTNTLAAPNFIVYTQAVVDGENWYTVRCSSEVVKWVLEQDDKQWYHLVDQTWHTIPGVFDLHEEVLLMLKLRWGI